MITLTLLHPVQLTPVQCWTFEDESVIRIGRSTDNHVVLYSAVVSRYHVEIQCDSAVWAVSSLGANGTYVDGKRIEQVPIKNGMIVRLARSGPNIQIHVGVSARTEAKKITGERTLSQRLKPGLEEHPPERESTQPLNSLSVGAQIPDRKTAVDPPIAQSAPLNIVCAHTRKTPDLRFCIDCGAPLTIQQVIGEYQVVKLLGQGGMGSTYLVWRDGKHLVLKTLNDRWIGDRQAVALFERESYVLKGLKHPGIPDWRDFFVKAGQPYLVMDMIYGRSLHQQVTKWGAVPQKQAIAWALGICNTLEYLHGQSVLHRDIRPENLIRRSAPTAFHEVTLIDFGAVRLLGLQSGTRIGSLGYTAPEQHRGIATPASDLYSLGATLAFLLSGQEPEAFYRYREQGHRFYPEYVPGLTTEIAQIIRRLTNPEAIDRYQSASEVAEVLRNVG